MARSHSSRPAIACIALVASLSALPATASATDYNVNSTSDAAIPNGCSVDTCTLREAVQEAANQTDQHIHLPEGVYQLSSTFGALPVTSTTLEISSNGPGLAQILGADQFTIFVADSPGAKVDLRLDQLELSHNPGEEGRALSLIGDSNDEITITNSQISHNSALNGGGGGGFAGAIFNHSGNVTISNSEMAFNYAAAGSSGGGFGGAIGADSGAVTTITNSRIGDNYAEGAPGASGTDAVGGAIAAYDGELTITNSAIDNNYAGPGLASTNARGGGLSLNNMSTEIEGSTISRNIAKGGASSDPGNLAGGQGGGIQVAGGTLTALNSTIAENLAEGTAGGGGGVGGGVLGHNSATVNLDQVTLASNSVTGSNSTGGNISLIGMTLGLDNTIIADGASGTASRENCSPSPNSINFIGNPINLTGRNIEDLDTCPLRASPADLQADPVLDSLDFYGGPTETMPIDPTGPAHDAAVSCNPPATDQRGRPRPNGACDIGAYEYTLGTLQANALGFGNRDIADGSIQDAVHAFNVGDEDVTIDSAVLGGPNASEFSVGSQFCAGTGPISPNDGCEVEIDFDPSSVGAKSATLTFTHDGANNPTVVNLTGAGTTPTIGGDPPGGGTVPGTTTPVPTGATPPKAATPKKKKAKCTKKKAKTKKGKKKKKSSCKKPKKKKKKSKKRK